VSSIRSLQRITAAARSWKQKSPVSREETRLSGVFENALEGVKTHFWRRGVVPITYCNPVNTSFSAF
jgi:hypothetical protein